MAVKKFDTISFHGKYVDESFQVDRDLSPNGEERRKFIADCEAEWDWWNYDAKRKGDAVERGDVREAKE